MRSASRRYDQEEYIYSRGRKILLSSIRTVSMRDRLDGAVCARGDLSRRISIFGRLRGGVRLCQRVFFFILQLVRRARWRDVREYMWTIWARMSPVRAWQYSLVFMLALGVAGTMFVYGSFGTNVSADESGSSGIIIVRGVKERVLGAEVDREDQDQFEGRVREMVKGYPIEDMLPYIFKFDRKTAAFLVSIARKESLWGKRVPVYYGEDCFNYWGYRGRDEIMGSAGHTCFDTPKDAVVAVGNRLQELIDEGLDTPSKLIVWKCGSSCAGHDPGSVSKWISDVGGYYWFALKGE